ncbi:MAG: symmetrical bis(5'-nucleosyl)-tetraphosphatase [Neisseria sp.]|nr:symmetrical bis(5'-nucleosyl)-tetraphosphatase [Neisseria sp.]
MTHYAIGDLQGCYNELTALLSLIDFQHGRDTLWLTGDIVNRGPKSLECLEFCMKHENSVQIVLGNHDLHLLALFYGFGKQKRGDTLEHILNHPDAARMRDWLRIQPLMRQNGNKVLIHAGLLPQWSVESAASLAAEVENSLQTEPQRYFAGMYGNKPSAWSDLLRGEERLRMITNVFTRMRALDFDNCLDYNFKSTLGDMPSDRRAWFRASDRQHSGHILVFGHWSALGYYNGDGVIGLDTGALWGGKLTAIDLTSYKITQMPSLKGLDWNKLTK